MKRSLLFRLLGLLLLVFCYLASAWRVWRIETRASGRERVHLRFTHDMLHASVRQAYADAIKDYCKLHPEVVIDAMEVPSRMFAPWRKTRLVGGTPPDMMRMGNGLSDEELAQYFVPLTAYVEQPNPYNQGTPLEKIPWKDTIIDGMTSELSYSRSLQEYFGITHATRTYRFFCNLDLLRRITGSERLPTTLAEFFSLCETIQIWARAHDQPVIPIAAYQESPGALLTPLVRLQTQRMSLAANRSRTLTVSMNQAALAWLHGDWSVDKPPVTDGWEMMRRVSRGLHPSFTQAQRNDASLGFLQQQAVMIASGTFDADDFMNHGRFRCGVFRLAPPALGDEPFWRNVIDANPDPTIGGGAATLGILRASPHFDVALDFLRYLTSAATNQKLAATMQLLPAVVGVPPDPRLEAFAIRTEGWPEGLDPQFTAWGNREIFRTVSVNLHRLVSPTGSVEEFTQALASAFPAAMQRDLEHVLTESVQRAQRTDSVLMANRQLVDPAAGARVSRLLENQAVAEGELAQLRHALAEYKRRAGTQR